jgi:2-dehydro-3-deoxygalactonokinase
MAHLIALDWGTSSLRAYLLDATGNVLERREDGPGIMKVENGAFEAALSGFCADWLSAYPHAGLVACGMIGSKQGWHEAPYCPCPAGMPALAANLAGIELASGRRLYMVPGVSRLDPDSGVPDVMRGEETQIMGALPATGSHLAVLPGTHSKWAWVEDGTIVSFASFMTGEVYAALTGHTILGRLMQHDALPDDAAFTRGVTYGLDSPGQLLSRIFSARTLGLFGQLDGAALPSYLSGLLIGSEIGAALAMRPAMQGLVLLGSPALTARYQHAFKTAGMEAIPGDADCAAHGMARIHAISVAR